MTDAERFRLLVMAVRDYAIYMLDPTGRVASWNAGAERFKGYTANEILGHHFSLFYTPDDRAAGLPATALQTARDHGKFEAEGWRMRKDGSRFWAHVVIDPILHNGELVGFAKITRDLTERRNNEQQLSAAREALFQSQKLEAIGKLTGGVAHDFNNLLSAIIGSLELAQKRAKEDPRLEPLLNNAMQAAQRGSSLTQRMLAFARRQELKPESVDVRTLVSGMIDLLSRSLGPSIEVATRFTTTLPRILVDPNQLEMSILNLAVNARDATPDGGSITISARDEMLVDGNRVRLPPGTYVVLSVQDYGSGMDAETVAKATEPFFTTKGVGKGTGLGLPMVMGMAEQSGGRLELVSAPGKGTTARLYFPIEQGPPLQTRQADAEAAGIQKDKLKVLAVDDDALVLLNTRMMLEDMGHHVTTAPSGNVAMRLLREGKPFDLLITDHGMPGMTGTQLIDETRKLKPGMMIVLATGYAELPDGAPEGIVRLAKPFFQRHLDDALQAVLKLRSG